VHLGIDAETLDIRAIEVTTNAIGNAPTLPDLLAQIPQDEQILSVGGMALTIPGRAMLPLPNVVQRRSFQSVATATMDEGRPGVDGRNEALRATKPLGRAIWKKWSGYHRRSLIETKMHFFKLLSQCVVAHTFDRQITELKVRATILNRFSKIGAPVTVRTA
jgi:hypothetical protein